MTNPAIEGFSVHTTPKPQMPQPEDVKPSHSRLRNIPFTQRELETLALLTLGRANKEIAQELSIEVNTVKTHLKGLFRKLEVHNRKTAALVALKEGIVEGRTSIAAR